MSKVNLKDNIWIEGFDDMALWNQKLCYLGQMLENNILIIYEGKTSKIPEELASQCCEYMNLWNDLVFYKQYNLQQDAYNFKTAKESIQSACPEEYCIIYKN